MLQQLLKERDVYHEELQPLPEDAAAVDTEMVVQQEEF